MQKNRFGYYQVGLLFCILFVSGLHAEKELLYDPEKGIIFADKNEMNALKKDTAQVSDPQVKLPPRKNPNDIHYNRKKDPPELYFRSGLEYFKNHDYQNALKNFIYADSLKQKPEHILWKGKTLRQLDKDEQMLSAMQQIIKNQPQSDVADDALLEVALYYHSKGDYDRATRFYTRLIEQYPFGVSFSTGEDLREVSQEQRKIIRAEVLNLLNFLGYGGDDLASSYRKFQKENKLEITGTGNSQTIKAIRKMHREHLEKDELKSQKDQDARKYSFWNILLISVGGINVMVLLFLRSRTKAAHKHVDELNAILKDLDTKKI